MPAERNGNTYLVPGNPSSWGISSSYEVVAVVGNKNIPLFYNPSSFERIKRPVVDSYLGMKDGPIAAELTSDNNITVIYKGGYTLSWGESTHIFIEKYDPLTGIAKSRYNFKSKTFDPIPTVDNFWKNGTVRGDYRAEYISESYPLFKSEVPSGYNDSYYQALKDFSSILLPTKSNIEAFGNTQLVELDSKSSSPLPFDSQDVGIIYQGKTVQLFYKGSGNSAVPVKASMWGDKQRPIAAEVRSGGTTVTVIFDTITNNNYIQIVRFNLVTGLEDSRYNFTKSKYESPSPIGGGGDYGKYNFFDFACMYAAGLPDTLPGSPVVNFNARYRKAMDEFKDILNPVQGVLGFLDTTKFKDVIRGTWKDSTSGKGSWSIDGTTIKGLFQPSSTANSVDLYLDIDKNGSITSIDKKVGFATVAAVSTGGQGTWNWSTSAKTGDYFGSNGQDAGLISINDTSFLDPASKWDAVYSSQSSILSSGLETLILTGSSYINGTGNSSNNKITGNIGRNILDGGLGKDVLTGLAGADTFKLSKLTDSLLATYDRITDFTFGEDKIQGPTSYSGKLNSQIVSIADIKAVTISKSLTAIPFKANTASLLTCGLQVFIALNDSQSGFDSNKDAIIELTGYKGGTFSIANMASSFL